MDDSGLPEDCWELILSRLAIKHDYGGLRSPSLVCKQFLSITNRLRHELNAMDDDFYCNGCEALFRALERFQDLKKLEVYGFSDFRNVDMIDYLISKITSSRLDLRVLKFYSFVRPPSAENFRRLGSTMKNLKILRCPNIRSLRDQDLATIADALPWLEELDISSLDYHHLHQDKVTDAGIEVISCKLQGLRRININGRHGCSDSSLIALSSNCVFLNVIQCRLCNMTTRGIFSVILRSPNIVSLQAGNSESSLDSSFTLDNSQIYARALRVLDLWVYEDLDRLLSSLAQANTSIQLKKLRLQNDSKLTSHGFLTFLRACPSLKYLELHNVNFLNNHSMRDLCRYLPNVESIVLWDSKINTTNFFILAKECPRLSAIELDTGYLEDGDEVVVDLEPNDRITSLDISSPHMNNELLKKIAVICPNLHELHVRDCDLLTTEGIGEVLKCCSRIKNLTVDKRIQMETFLKQFKTRHINIEYWDIYG